MRKVAYTIDIEYNRSYRTDWQRLARKLFRERLTDCDLKIIDKDEATRLLKTHDYPICRNPSGFWNVSLMKFLCMIDFFESDYDQFLWLDLDTYITNIDKPIFPDCSGFVCPATTRGKVKSDWHEKRYEGYRKICDYLRIEPVDDPLISGTWYMSFGRDRIKSFRWYVENIPKIRSDLGITGGNELFVPVIINHFTQFISIGSAIGRTTIVINKKDRLRKVDMQRHKLIQLAGDSKDRFYIVKGMEDAR